MDGRLVAVLIVGIVVVSSSALITADLLNKDTKDLTEDDNNTSDDTVPKIEHNITYVLYDGTNSENNPDKYVEGVETKLYAAAKDGCVFIGWFLEDTFDNEITTISTTSTEDITLYAYWEDSEVGECFTYTISGNYVRYTGPFRSETPLSGSITYTYLAYKYGKGYYVGYNETLTSGTGRFATTHTYSDQYWSGESDTVWTQGENATIDTIHGSKECETWTSTTTKSTETQYVGADDGITYLMEYQETDGRNTYTVTYTLSETHTTVIDDSFTVDVYCDKGITVVGYGESAAYEKVTLIAFGQSFAGWYSASGTLISTSKTYTIDTLLSDVTLYARNGDNTDLSFNSTAVTATPDITLTDVTWTIDDNGSEVTRTGNTLSYTYSQAGMYTILYTGTDASGKVYHGLYDIFVDGTVTKTYSWSYDSHNYTATLDILYSDFLEYRNDDIKRSQGTTSHDIAFVTYEDPYIIELIGQIQTQCLGETDAYTANVILAFTQYIEYQYDSDSMGQEEYWKYPLETLFDECGDCEDTSILFCALAKAGGYDCALILYSGHMAAGINVSGITGSGYYDYSNVRYYYCETTATGWDVGDTPNSSLRLQKVMPISS